MELAQKRGALLSKQLAYLQVGYLLTCFRQRVLTEPAVLASGLTTGGFFNETRRHEAAEMIKTDLCAMLEELTDLPYRISDPDWISKVDPDLSSQVEGDGESGGRAANPSGLRRKAEQAKRRRRQKTEAMRRLRAEGRVKS